MLGITVAPRWRLPLWIVVMLSLTGCVPRLSHSGGSPLPTVRMAMVKIPLNGDGAGTDVLRDAEPIERFSPEPVAAASGFSW